MPSPLSVYLRNHEAAGRAGFDLFRRTVANHRDKPYAEDLAELAAEVREDLDSVQTLMRRAGVQPDLLLGVALRLGERVGRLKPNGRLVRRAPLSDLIEIELLVVAVQAKAAGWRALAAAGLGDHSGPLEIATLIQRADKQAERLAAIHRSVAAAVLTPIE